MLPSSSPRKAPKSPGVDININVKTSVTCTNVPESLFDANVAKKHFSKFGRVQKIRLIPKRLMCIIEYDQPMSAERAVLNAGAFDGFMFDVTRTKSRIRRKSRKEDDPDWVPDSDVEEELNAMRGAPSYKLLRSKDVESPQSVPTSNNTKQAHLERKTKPILRKAREKSTNVSQQKSGIESPVLVASVQTTLSTSEAAAELYQLRSKISLTPDEQWRTLDARDRILRAWGGAGSRVKVGGATIGTCSDMCPEKERLHRQAEHQVMTLETVPGSDGQLEPWRAVKQYSRSSADQEIPMCYELRPAPVLMQTCAYLLQEVADTTRQVTLADWFHFMWDRLRSIRKDITQQALCCAESIRLVEMCARFHAHCAARLADLEHTQFDQKLNTDNLTKCLQTLKHMYNDVGPEKRPCEAEFRGYIALLNLGDSNFWWEIKQLPLEIQKSKDITFAIQVFNALDNNNYVRFFRLVNEKATYLQACILLRYFNDVRARALARIVKAYAPRGGSRFPAEDLMSALAFESLDSMKSFICHYGLRFSKSDMELAIVLDRHQFIEDSDPYPITRAVELIESKRNSTVCSVIAGGEVPRFDYENHNIYSSFDNDGKLKESALIAEEQGYNTINDTNKDISALKTEIQRLVQGGKIYSASESKTNLFVKSEPKPITLKSSSTFHTPSSISVFTPESKLFSFTPAIPVAPSDIIKNSPENIFEIDAKNVFLFSKPQTIPISNMFTQKDRENVINAPVNKNLKIAKPVSDIKSVFSRQDKRDYTEPFQRSDNVFRTIKNNAIKPIFETNDAKSDSKNVFGKPIVKDIDKSSFNANSDSIFGSKNIFSGSKENIFKKTENIVKLDKNTNIFSKTLLSNDKQATTQPSNIFGGVVNSDNLFTKPIITSSSTMLVSNGGTDSNKLSPGSIFKSATLRPNSTDSKNYSIFQSKNKAQTVADNILNSINNTHNHTVYEFNQNSDELENQIDLQESKDTGMIAQEQFLEEERKKKEFLRQEEERRKEEVRIKQEVAKKLEALKKLEELKRQEELRRLEEKRKKQEEIKRKVELDRLAALKQKAEKERKFKEAVEKESVSTVHELFEEVTNDTVCNILKDEIENLRELVKYAEDITEEIIIELNNEICDCEMKAEIFWNKKIMKKWFYVWRRNYKRNCKRRNLLEETPLWLTENTPIEEALHIRRSIENVALKNMNAIHRGYKFTGELKPIPLPDPFNVIDLIRSSLLKRMKQINYPYDKCFFWKTSLVIPNEAQWIYKKINLEQWLISALSDDQKHESENVIHVGKYSWNHLIDFAISISMIKMDKLNYCAEATEGTNGILLFFTEKGCDILKKIEETLKHKYQYQITPLAIVIAKCAYSSLCNSIEEFLSKYVETKVISAFKIFVIDPDNVPGTLMASTKSALKWIAKHYPPNPPLEIDYLKSICQRYLGNEIWCNLKTDHNSRLNNILKDLNKLIKCYNIAVDKLVDIITNEDHFNYMCFPIEFKKYLDKTSPYPKPYEFIPGWVKTSENTLAIKNIMRQLKLPHPISQFNPGSVSKMQQQIRSYCNQIGWFNDPEEVVCKVVTALPDSFFDMEMSEQEFTKIYEQFDLIDVLNIIVYEKINMLGNFDNRFAIYEKSMLQDYCNSDWLYETSVLSEIKHKAIEYGDDDDDYFIEAKRRKLEIDSLEYLMLEDKDQTMVEESIKSAEKSISTYNNCSESVMQLELQLEEGNKKSIEFENMLKAALSDF